jgi:hypothetical protein
VAGFVLVKLLSQIIKGVIHQTLRPQAPRLRAPTHLSILIHVKITAARPAFEWRNTLQNQSSSITRKVHKPLWHLAEDLLKRHDFGPVCFQPTAVIMKKQNAWGKTYLPGKSQNRFGFVRRARAKNTTHDHAKIRVLPQPFQAFLQVRQNLLGRLIGVNAIDGNLHFLEPGPIQRLDQIRLQKKAVGNHTSAKETKPTTNADQIREPRM